MKVLLCPWSDCPMWYRSSTRLEHFGGRLFFLLDLLFFLAPDSSVEVPLSVNFEDRASLGPSNCPGSGSPHTKGLCEFWWVMHNEWWRREKLGDQECWVLPSPHSNSHCPLEGCGRRPLLPFCNWERTCEVFKIFFIQIEFTQSWASPS